MRWSGYGGQGKRVHFRMRVAAFCSGLLVATSTDGFLLRPTGRRSRVVRGPVQATQDDAEPADESSTAPDVTSDWREFRARLVAGGITTTEEQTEGDAPAAEDKAPASPPRSVSRRNEALLREQNPALATEYLDGMWAHAIPNPEVGCLLVRLPFETEVVTTPGPWRDLVLKTGGLTPTPTLTLTLALALALTNPNANRLALALVFLL